MPDLPKPPAEFNPDWVIHPGAILQEEINARFGAAMGMHQHCMNEILSGKGEINEATAAQIALIMGTSRDMWLNMERDFREGLAAGKPWVSKPHDFEG